MMLKINVKMNLIETIYYLGLSKFYVLYNIYKFYFYSII